ncbi:MAG: hypothetical protein V3W28_05570 [Thermoplasmata archaeon]
MRTAYFVAGIVLLVLGIGLAILAGTWIGATCTDDRFMAQALGIPTCYGLLIQTGAVAFGGLVFIVIGILLLTRRKESQASIQHVIDAPTPPWASPPRVLEIIQIDPPVEPVPQTEQAERFCPKCGRRYGSEVDFCQKDGTPLQAPQ